MATPSSRRAAAPRAPWLPGLLLLCLAVPLLAADPLADLMAGNRRRSLGPAVPAPSPRVVIVTRADLVRPPAVLFDAAPGELFVVATADGRLSNPAALASAEYAATQLGVRLIVVLTPSAAPDGWRALCDDIAAAWRSSRLARVDGLRIVPAAVDPGGKVSFGPPLPAPTEPAPIAPATLPSLADAVARVHPAVVTVVGYALGSHTPGGEGDAARESSGAGVVLDAARGWVVTAQHVVEGVDRLVVRLSDGRAFPASVVGQDETSDLALLKVPADRLTAAPIGHSTTLRPGDWVLALGHPFQQFEHTATVGIVSALGRGFEIETRSYAGLIQTDAAMNRGSSGGPLCNAAGEVVGISVAIYSPTQTSLGIGFAMPIEDVLQRAEHLGRDGALPFAGLTLATVTADLASELRLAEPRGIAITRVVAGGPASAGGVRRRDLLTAVGNLAVTTAEAAEREILRHRAGESVTLQVRRNGQAVTCVLTLGRRPPGVSGGL